MSLDFFFLGNLTQFIQCARQFLGAKRRTINIFLTGNQIALNNSLYAQGITALEVIHRIRFARVKKARRYLDRAKKRADAGSNIQDILDPYAEAFADFEKVAVRYGKLSSIEGYSIRK